MEVCSNCFADIELQAFIETTETTGNCDICGSENSQLIDLGELSDFFNEVFKNFVPNEAGKPLLQILDDDWKIFSDSTIAETILKEALANSGSEIPSPTESVSYNQEITDNYSHWDTLKHELKWNRRFISNEEKLSELGWDGFFNNQYDLNRDKILYRARLHHKSDQPPYLVTEMLCPDPIYAKAGRANPSGIPYLYLSEDPQTVIHEVRATYLDELSIGEFSASDAFDPLKIVDFTERSSLYSSKKISETIKSQLLTDYISKDLSKPMRRYDSEIEYIPTQFICEFINVITGAHGIRFNSSVNPTGKNLVIFDQLAMTCNNVKLVQISELNLTYVELT